MVSPSSDGRPRCSLLLWGAHGIGVFLISGALLAYIQFASPHLVDHDGYYHIKVASLMRDHGIPLSFPWLKFTLLDEAGYTDHHLFQHILQIPFTYLGDLRLAAKWAAVSFAALAFTAFYLLLWRSEIRFPFLWLLVLFASSHAFLFRMSMPRGQSLSLALQLVAAHFLLTRNALGVAFLAAVFVWTYNGFPILLPLTACGVLTHMYVKRKIEYSLIVGLGVGICFGLVCHPYFPRDVLFLWHHIVPKLFASEYSTSVGAEWYPYNSWALLNNAPLALGGYLSGILLTNREEWKLDAPRFFWLLVSTVYVLLLCKSRRFVEYFPPAAIMFLALSVRGWWREVDLSQFPYSKIQLGGGLIGGLVLMITLYFTITAVRQDIAGSPPTERYQGGAEWLATHTPPGATVFHTDWDDFPMLFYFNTHNTYVVGLDPDFMRLKNEPLFRSWEAITRGKVPAPEDIILKDFGCEYVLTDNDHHEFLTIASRRPRMRKAYTDQHVTIYRVLSPTPLLELPAP